MKKCFKRTMACIFLLSVSHIAYAELKLDADAKEFCKQASVDMQTGNIDKIAPLFYGTRESERFLRLFTQLMAADYKLRKALSENFGADISSVIGLSATPDVAQVLSQISAGILSPNIEIKNNTTIIHFSIRNNRGEDEDWRIAMVRGSFYIDLTETASQKFFNISDQSYNLGEKFVQAKLNLAKKIESKEIDTVAKAKEYWNTFFTGLLKPPAATEPATQKSS